MRMDAPRALELGLVTEVVPRDQLLQRAMEIAEDLNTWSAPLAVRATRATYWTTTNLHYADARPWGRVYDNQVRFHTEDFKEGKKAAREGRKPEFKGR